MIKGNIDWLVRTSGTEGDCTREKEVLRDDGKNADAY